MASELDHLALPWEVIEEDGAFKVRPEHATLLNQPDGSALLQIGAAKPFCVFSFATPNARELAQRMVDLHNAALKK